MEAASGRPVIPWWRTHFGEMDILRVSEAIRAGNISQGKVTRRFEEALAERLGVPYVVCTSSGTTALTMALMAAHAEDAVVVPNRTWIATAHAVIMAGGDVSLADVDESGLLGTFKAPRRLTTIVPVHLNGRHVEIAEEILDYCERSEVAIIEDSCQSFPLAPRGTAACYSMSTAKLLPTGQGGFVATRDEGFYRECLSLRTHDVADAMNPVPIKWRRFGYNFRYTDIQASIGLAQLATLEDRIARLHEIRALYAAGLPPWLELLPCDGVPLYTEVLLEDSERLREYLLSKGIQARPNYPSLDSAPYLHASGEFPNSRRFEKGLTLPSGPAQSDADVKFTLECLHSWVP